MYKYAEGSGGMIAGEAVEQLANIIKAKNQQNQNPPPNAPTQSPCLNGGPENSCDSPNYKSAARKNKNIGDEPTEKGFKAGKKGFDYHLKKAGSHMSNGELDHAISEYNIALERHNRIPHAKAHMAHYGMYSALSAKADDMEGDAKENMLDEAHRHWEKAYTLNKTAVPQPTFRKRKMPTPDPSMPPPPKPDMPQPRAKIWDKLIKHKLPIGVGLGVAGIAGGAAWLHHLNKKHQEKMKEEPMAKEAARGDIFDKVLKANNRLAMVFPGTMERGKLIPRGVATPPSRPSIPYAQEYAQMIRPYTKGNQTNKTIAWKQKSIKDFLAAHNAKTTAEAHKPDNIRGPDAPRGRFF